MLRQGSRRMRCVELWLPSSGLYSIFFLLPDRILAHSPHENDIVLLKNMNGPLFSDTLPPSLHLHYLARVTRYIQVQSPPTPTFPDSWLFNLFSSLLCGCKSPNIHQLVPLLWVGSSTLPLVLVLALYYPLSLLLSCYALHSNLYIVESAEFDISISAVSHRVV